MNSLEKILLSRVGKNYSWLAVYRRTGAGESQIAKHGDSAASASVFSEKIVFENLDLGLVEAKSSEVNFFTDFRKDEIRELARVVAPLLAHASNDEKLDRSFRLLNWVWNAREIEPSVCDWIGIYFKESFLKKNASTDLLLGAFLGLATDHVRIPLNRGLCGLALREEKVVNVMDVRKESEHIACSLTTRSELVIPLKDSRGNFIAELDIDCDELAAFSPSIEEQFRSHAESFAAVVE